jgi:ketosteroid isomerase-like protein
MNPRRPQQARREMKQYLLCKISIVIGYLSKFDLSPFMNNDEAVKQVLSDYYNAFSTLDVQSILPYFHQPALLIGPLGVIAIPTPAAVVPIFGSVMEDLRQRKYRRSELSLQQFKLLSATSALAVGAAIRYKADGQELERVGVTYLLHKGNDGWKFAVMVLHDTDKVAPRE